MIGNDIVDLELSDGEVWKRKRFLDKVFHRSEQETIRASENPGQTLWRLWSMKESAYKLHLRKMPERRLNPIRFRCLLLDDLRGLVRADSRVYHTRSDMTSAYIHTLATEDPSEDLITNSGIVRKNNGESLRLEIINRLKRSFSESQGLVEVDLKFEKDDRGLPALHYFRDIPRMVPCSISHHGSHGAYAIQV